MVKQTTRWGGIFFAAIVWMVATGSIAGRLCAAVVPPVVRGGGVALIRSSGGSFRIRVSKRDLNIYPGADVVTVSVTDPFLRPVVSKELPDDGQAERGGRFDVQTAEFDVTDAVAGIYRVRVSGSGGDYMWGIETDAGKLVIDAGLALNDGSVSGRVYFRAPAGAFEMKAQAFHAPGVQKLPLFDAAGTQIHVFDLDELAKDRVFAVAAEQGNRDGLWYVASSALDIKLSVPGNPVWTMDADAYFTPPADNAALLPRFNVRYLQPGENTTVTLRFYKPSDADGGAYEFSVKEEGEKGAAVVRAMKVLEAPQPGTSADQVVVLDVATPKEARVGSARATWIVASRRGEQAPLASASVEVRVGTGPVGKPLDLPIVNTPHRHENAQFGYAPEYVANEVYFDPRNRPFIRNRFADKNWTSALTFLEDGAWHVRPFVPAIRAVYPDFSRFSSGAGFMACKVAFDGHGGAYTLLRLQLASGDRPSVLLYTPDDGRTWSVAEMLGNGFDIENFSGHNAQDGPPAVLNYEFRARHPEAKWGAYHRLLLRFPRVDASGKVSLSDPVVVSEDCIGSCQHSGGPPSLATRNGRTHIVWGDATDEDVPGVPTYITTYHHDTQTLDKKVFLGYAPPPNDVHNVPAVCLDSEGYIHIITGAHGDNFTYRRSVLPNDIGGGFTPAVNTLDAGWIGKNTDADGSGRQTYCSLVCDDQDTLHIAFRQWRQGPGEFHGGNNYGALSIQSKPKGGPWGPARPMVIPPVAGYSIYYHKLTIDRTGGLWLSYSYLAGDKTYQDQFRELYNNRALLVSKDHGATWKLAETRDFPDGK